MMKIVIGEIMENEVLCETDEDSMKLPRSLFPRGVHSGDIADYEDGVVTMWDEERQVEEEQLAMFFKMMC
ncbi:MAG: hypothetical protein EOM34_04750 [Clostridia bacterium]|nr:hypothetical protein [Lachnospiraceae bacterium]NCB99979.1 hypothetical protein [Clostridia bacterium]NCD03690.1 hypothetical protein [Clostridia bacterium]